jgi:hypothetical protein
MDVSGGSELAQGTHGLCRRRPRRSRRVSRLHPLERAGFVLVALTMTLLGALLLAASPAMAAEDKTPPQIGAFNLTPLVINTESADQTLSVTMTLTDDQSGVASQSDPYTHGAVFVRLAPVGGTQLVDIAVHRVSGDSLDGVYTGSAVVPSGSMGGIWHVTWLQLVDMLGNRADLDWQGLEARFGAGCATVTNQASSSDGTPPQITAFSITPSQINTDASDQTLSVTMTLTDDRSGVACLSDPYTHGAVFVRFSPAGGTQSVDIAFHRVSGDGLNGVYAGTAAVPKGSIGGLWRVSWLQLVDMLGNRADLTWQTLEARFGAGCASVTNAASSSDSAPPQITSFSLAPLEIDTASADQSLTVTMTLTDDRSGVACLSDPYTHGGVFVRLTPLVGTQAVDIAVRRVSGDGLNGVYTGTAVVPKGSKEGIWEVSWLSLVDMLGNRQDLNADALAAMLPSAQGVLIANTAEAHRVTIDRQWTISTARTSVTFPAGTVVTRQDNGSFAFYRMASSEFSLDDSTPTTDLYGVPLATLRFGIPGLDLAFDRPVTVSMSVATKYEGFRLRIEALSEGAAAWANETVCEVVNGRCTFTVDHATRFVASGVKPRLSALSPAKARRGATVTIIGQDFGKKRGVVTFGTRRCNKLLSWSNTRVKCRVPATTKLGKVSVKVTTAIGTSNAKRLSVKR